MPINTKTKYQVLINEKWCKGCAICVEFCPTNVLVMSEGLAKVKNLEACIGCGLCELRCPDFAITVSENITNDTKSNS